MPAPTFTFKVTAADTTETKFDVISFTGEERISQPFEYRLVLRHTDPQLDFSKVVNQNAELKMEQVVDATASLDDNTTKIAGIVSSFRMNRTYEASGTKYVECEAVLVPKLWRLKMFHQSRVFQGLDVQEIIERVFAQEVSPGVPVLGQSDYAFKTEGTYEKREFCAQYRESDLDFIQRLMEHEGWYYFYDNGVLIISDIKTQEFKLQVLSEVNFQQANEGPNLKDDQIYEFIYDEHVVPRAVEVRDYDYESFAAAEQVSHDTSMANTTAGAPEYARVGTHYEHGLFTVERKHPNADYKKSGDPDLASAGSDDGTRRTSQVERIALVRAQELEAQRVEGRGKSNATRLQAGHRFSLQKHFRFTATGANEFLITSVQHRFEPLDNQETRTNSEPGKKPEEKGPTQSTTKEMNPAVYRNTFTCLPSSIQYRPPRITPVPRVPGVMTAKVVAPSPPVAPTPPDTNALQSVKDQYAEAKKQYDADLEAYEERLPFEGPVDEEGRYHVEIPFDPDPENGSGVSSTSKRVRLAQPHAGTDYGFHFPNRPDTEMVFACLDGDPDRPVGLSMLANPWTHTPVPTTANKLGSQNPNTGSAAKSSESTFDKYKNVIRSARGHQIILDDNDAGANVGMTFQVGKAENSTGRDIYWGSKIELGGYRHLSVLERTLGIISTAVGYFRTVFTRDFPGMASEVLAIMASQVMTDDYVDDTFGTTTPIGVNIWTNKNVNVTGKDGVNIGSPNLFGMFSTSLFNGDDDSKNQYQAEAISKFIINTIWQDVINGTADEIMDSREDELKYKTNPLVNPKVKAGFKWRANFKEQRLSALIFTLLQRTGVNISSMGELKLTSLQSTSVAAGQGGMALKSFGNIEQKADLGVEISSHEGIKISTKGRPYKGKGVFKALGKLGDAVSPALKAFIGQFESRFANLAKDPNEMFPIEISNDDGDIFLHTGGAEQKGTGDIMSHVEGKGDFKAFVNKGRVHMWSGNETQGIVLEVGSRNGLGGDNAVKKLMDNKLKGRVELKDKKLEGFSSEQIELKVGSSVLDTQSKLIMKDGSILIKCGQASIELKKSGDITFKGKKILLDAMQEVTVKALDVKVDAQKEVEIKGGLGVTTDGGLTNDVKGTLVTVDGTLTSIKGSLVKAGS